jgi:hypothetical protein
VRFCSAPLPIDPAERRVIVVPARVHRDHVGLAFAECTGGAGPAAQLDIAGVIELGFVEADQRFQMPGGELFQEPLVPGQFRI